MADSSITVSGLTATGSIGQISLTWDSPIDPHTPGGLPTLQFKVTEVWASQTNEFMTATKIGETPGNTFVHAGLARGAVWYYWIRTRDRSDLEGEPFPATLGVSGTEANNDVLLEQVGFFRNSNGLLEQWGFAIADSTGVATTTLPTPFTQFFSITATPILIGVGSSSLYINVLSFDFDLISFRVERFLSGAMVPTDGLIFWRATGL